MSRNPLKKKNKTDNDEQYDIKSIRNDTKSIIEETICTNLESIQDMNIVMNTIIKYNGIAAKDL